MKKLNNCLLLIISSIFLLTLLNVKNIDAHHSEKHKEEKVMKKLDIYKCDNCGIITKILKAGKGELICCNKAMIKIAENIVDAANEKHIPVITKTEKGLKVNVGEVNHPMDLDHYIEWIELISNNVSFFKFLNPSDKPEAVFKLDQYDNSNVYARAYCNLHGLWKN